MSEEVDTPTPETFDLASWTAGAARPERSVTVYRNASGLADMDELLRQIQNLEAAGAVEDEALGDDSPSIADLQAQYRDLAEEIEAGKLTVRVRGLIVEEIQAIKKDVGKRLKGKATTTDEMYELLAEAVVFPKLDADGWRQMNKAIGGQFLQIQNAYIAATNGIVDPSIPFSQKSSERESGRR